MHCLIVRDVEGLTVRRWAANTRLNGAAFDEAPLAEGDCLTVCNVELELFPTRPVEAQTARWMPQPNKLNDDLLDTMQESVDAMAELDDSTVAAEPLLLEYDPAVADSQAVEPTAGFEPIAGVEEPSATVAEPVVLDCRPIVPTEPETRLANTEELHASDAAEIVFQELQMACANSRVRSRKLLAALRAKQEDYSELAERLSDVEAQLAELRKLRNEWDESQFCHEAERREWETQLHELRRQLCECELRLAEHAQQVAELRLELAAVRSSESAVEEPYKAATDECDSPSTSQVCDWLPVDMAPQASVNELDGESEPVVSIEVTNQSQLAETAEPFAPSAHESTSVWNAPAATDDWAAVHSEVAEPEHATPVKDESFGEEPAAADRTAGNDEPINATTEPTEKSVTEAEAENPFAQFSIWKQGVLKDALDHEEPAVAGPASRPTPASICGGQACVDESKELAEIVPSEAPTAAVPVVEQPNAGATAPEVAPVEVAEATRPKPQQTSFIERYSHMFGEEGAEATAPAAPVQQMPAPVVISPPPREAGIARSVVAEPKTALSEDEESVEQYMAKLLERMRRDAPAGASSQAPPATAEETAAEEAAAEESASQRRVAAAKAEAAQAEPSEPMSEADAEREIATWRSGDRTPMAPASDLGALRAIANQTARRAISRHQLAKHKRVATTKVIVSTLVGMTSLWLMLLAPKLHDLQFIAACVGLVAAAYWAGEAFRALLRSRKAAAYRGSDDDLLQDSGEHQHAGLPIDVEDRF